MAMNTEHRAPIEARSGSVGRGSSAPARSGGGAAALKKTAKRARPRRKIQTAPIKGSITRAQARRIVREVIAKRLAREGK